MYLVIILSLDWKKRFRFLHRYGKVEDRKVDTESIGSKSLNRCKKADVKFNGLFLLIE